MEDVDGSAEDGAIGEVGEFAVDYFIRQFGEFIGRPFAGDEGVEALDGGERIFLGILGAEDGPDGANALPDPEAHAGVS